jgi:hypothetical protein
MDPATCKKMSKKVSSTASYQKKVQFMQLAGNNVQSHFKNEAKSRTFFYETNIFAVHVRPAMCRNFSTMDVHCLLRCHAQKTEVK